VTVKKKECLEEMMNLKSSKNKKRAKIMAALISAVFVIGVFTLALTQSGVMGTNTASAAAHNSTIGVVNMQMIMKSSKQVAAANTTLQKEVENAKADFKTKSANMTDSEKKQFAQQLDQRLRAKDAELMEPVIKEIKAAIEKVADKKGLEIVVENNYVITGGVDITAEVGKELAK
jgi:outer membrane protein